MNVLRLKRVYEPPSKEDGTRILTERLWPRGLSKKKAAVDLWLKDLGPAPELRKWFGHDPEKWEEFRKRYFVELRGKKELLETLKQKMKEGRVTLVYAARDQEHNAAVALSRFLGK